MDDDDDSCDNDYHPPDAPSPEINDEDTWEGQGDSALKCLQAAVDINIFDEDSDDDGEEFFQKKNSSPSI